MPMSRRCSRELVSQQQRIAIFTMEDSSFLGPSPPPEIKRAFPLLAKLDQKELRALLPKALSHLRGEDVKETDLAALQLKDPTSAPTLFTALYLLLRSAVKSKSKVEIIQNELLEHKIPEPLVVDLVKFIQTTRAEAEQTLYTRRIRLPALDTVKWRVDITISTGSLLRVMRPTILMHLTLTDGSTQSFEVSVERFHDLRYNVARVMKEMEELEKLPILKL